MTGEGASVEALIEKARRWAEIDHEYGHEIRALLDRATDTTDTTDPAGEGAAARLRELFSGRIAFGTAGLRAAMAPGPRRMNRLVVQQTTAGLMDWLPPGPKVVIGFDARHHSERFARDVVTVVARRGGTPLIVGRPAPTPVLARAVLDHGADAGIMVTASHNPPADNGYKLYLGDGIQLVDPADAEIAAAIDRVADEAALDPADWERDDWADAVDIGEAALTAHRKVVVDTLFTDHRHVRVLYSAMHGVGGAHLLDCFSAAGFPEPAVVAEQFEPDPTFPTAPFPNPEEPGAMDLALATAAESTAAESTLGEGTAGLAAPVDLVLANDPDADRLAVAIPDGDGVWRRLSGDDVGALLADHVLRHRPAGDRPWVVASSIVSSRYIDSLAEAEGGRSIRTLTGFKWVARPIVEADADYLFGFEEALGYCIGTGVRDKDGISAALVMAELAAECRAEGMTVWQRLDRLIERLGRYATSQVTVGFGDRSESEQEEIRRASVAVAPERLAGLAVIDREDLSEGRHLPPTAGVVLGLEDGSRVIVRPSGTEPKVKAYLEVITEPGDAKEARRDAELRLDRLTESVTGLLNRP